MKVIVCCHLDGKHVEILIVGEVLKYAFSSQQKLKSDSLSPQEPELQLLATRQRNRRHKR